MMRPARVPRIGLIVTLTTAFSVCALLGTGINYAAADQKDQIQKAQRQFEAGDYKAAVTSLQSVISQEPNSAEARYWLGRAYYENRDYDNAAAQEEKAASLDPKNSIYHQWLG